MVKLSTPQRRAIGGILSGEYTPYDLREFVHLCYGLACPLIRKKVRTGRIDLSMIGLNEADLIYDCLADLFRRDEHGHFPYIQSFLNNHICNLTSRSDEDILIALSYLVVGQMNKNMIRIYSEADPTLGKILRNLKNALDKTNLFDQTTRFDEIYLLPRGVDPLRHCPALSPEWLDQAFSEVVLIHDTV
ncbi:MAG: hypothetical protein HY707_08585, partial [Ignavibacteriae bacterium]|nr:hypothetical protein [Ignavibacteriota bacterium]